ncbi:MAG: FkbM family methyltransferase [Patescibacteria group bacterium]|nr:FkbM family methyltransferase [Patescibacteria group bacterium]
MRNLSPAHILLLVEKVNHAYLQYYSGTGLVHLRRLFRYPRNFVMRGLSKIGFLDPVKPRSAKTFWGTDIFVLLPDSDAGSLYYFGFLPNREYKLTRFLIQHLKSSDVFYDVGANYGFYAALAKNFIQEGEIHVFEPHPLLFPCIQKTMENISNIFLNNFALSNKKGLISFFDAYGKRHSGGSTIMKTVAEQRPQYYQQITIQASTLDEYVKKHTLPTIIKIDVEGGEYKVLKGSEAMIRHSKPLIITELWGGENWSIYAQPVLDLLDSWGYMPHSLDKEGNLHVEQFSQLEKTVSRVSYDNVVFLPK